MPSHRTLGRPNTAAWHQRGYVLFPSLIQLFVPQQTPCAIPFCAGETQWEEPFAVLSLRPRGSVCPPTHSHTRLLLRRVRTWSLPSLPVVLIVHVKVRGHWISEIGRTRPRWWRSKPHGGNSCRSQGIAKQQKVEPGVKPIFLSFSRADRDDGSGDALEKTLSMWRPSCAPTRFRARAFREKCREMKGVLLRRV